MYKRFDEDLEAVATLNGAQQKKTSRFVRGKRAIAHVQTGLLTESHLAVGLRNSTYIPTTGETDGSRSRETASRYAQKGRFAEKNVVTTFKEKRGVVIGNQPLRPNRIPTEKNRVGNWTSGTVPVTKDGEVGRGTSPSRILQGESGEQPRVALGPGKGNRMILESKFKENKNARNSGSDHSGGKRTARERLPKPQKYLRSTLRKRKTPEPRTPYVVVQEGRVKACDVKDRTANSSNCGSVPNVGGGKERSTDAPLLWLFRK